MHKTAYFSLQFAFLVPIKRLETKETRYCTALLAFVELILEAVNTWLRINGDRNKLLGDERGKRETKNPLLQSFKKLVDTVEQ